MDAKSKKLALALVFFAVFAALLAFSLKTGLDSADAEREELSGDGKSAAPRQTLREWLATTKPDSGSGPQTEAAYGSAASAKAADRTPSDATLASMSPLMRFSARVWEARGLSPEMQIREARKMLKSKSAEERALGAVLLFFNQALDGDAERAIAKDASLAVPLTLLDWMKDFGDDEDGVTLKALLGERDISDAELVDYLKGSASAVGGGRSALDLIVPRHDEETVGDVLGPVVASKDAAYDVREQALFKLLEPETKAEGLEVLDKLLAEAGNGEDSLWVQSLAKWKEFSGLRMDDDEEDEGAEEEEEPEDEADDDADETEEIDDADADGDDGETEDESGEEADDGPDEGEEEEEDVPYKVWDTPVKGLSFLADSEIGLTVRCLANYLEYGLRRDDPDFEPVVEEGSYEIAKAFFERALEKIDSLLPEEAEALDRLAASIDRLAEYDPAFVIDDEDDPDADEEIDVEILDEEDRRLADLLDEEDEGEEEEEDDDPEAAEDDDGDDGDDGDDEGEDEDEDEDSDFSTKGTTK